MDLQLKQKLAKRLEDNLQDPKNPLYPKQRDIQQEIADFLNDPDKPAYGYIKRPTGTGKTAQFLNAAVAMGEKTLIVVPRKLLAQQTKQDMLTKYGFPIREDEIGIYDSDQSEADREAALKKKYVITIYNSFNTLTKKGVISSDPNADPEKGQYYFPVVMLDEVHRARAEAIQTRVDPFLDSSLVLGWTASDKFRNGTDVGEAIFRGQKPIHTTTIAQAIEDDEISSFKNIVVKTKVGFGIKLKPGAEDFSQEQIDQVVSQKGRDEKAIDMYLNYYDEDTGVSFRNKSAIAYCGSVDHASKLAEKFNRALAPILKEGEIGAMVISGNTPTEDYVRDGVKHWGRNTILKKYKEGKIKVLTNADLLIEGFDAPNASVCFMMRPTASPIVAEQTGGRVLRKDKRDPDKFAYIVNMEDEGLEGGIRFGDIAGGMEITHTEAKRQKLIRGKSERPLPAIKLPEDMVDIAEADIISNVTELEEMRATRSKNQTRVPAREAGWLTAEDLCRTLTFRSGGEKQFRKTDRAFGRLWDLIRSQVTKAGEEVEAELANGMKIAAGWKRLGDGKQALCVKPTEPVLEYLWNSYGLAPAILPENTLSKTDGWLSENELVAKLNEMGQGSKTFNTNHRSMQRFWGDVQDKCPKTAQTSYYSDLKIPVAWMANSKGTLELCMKPDDEQLGTIYDTLGIYKEDTHQWKNMEALRRVLDKEYDLSIGSRAWADFSGFISDRFKQEGGNNTITTVDIQGAAVSMRQIQSMNAIRPQLSVLIDEKTISDLKHVLEERGVTSRVRLPGRTHGNFNAQDLATLTGCKHVASAQDFISEIVRDATLKYGRMKPWYRAPVQTSIGTFQLVAAGAPTEDKNYKLFIPEGDTQALEAIKSRLQIFDSRNDELFKHLARKATSAEALNAIPDDQIPCHPNKNIRNIPTQIGQIMASPGIRARIIRIVDELKLQVLEPPYFKAVELPNGATLPLGITNENGRKQFSFICNYGDPKDPHCADNMVKNLIESAQIELAKEAQATAQAVSPSQNKSMERLGLSGELKKHFGDYYDAGEFTEFMTRIGKAVGDAPRSVVHIPDGEGGSTAIVVLNVKGILQIEVDPDPEKTLKTISDYMYDIKEKQALLPEVRGIKPKFSRINQSGQGSDLPPPG
jgi:superfamily II DNA or RNA helicase